MTDTTTRPTYTLTVAGRDWVFTPAAIDVLSVAGLSPLLIAITLGPTNSIRSGQTEVTLGRVKVLVTRHGRRITVKPLEADEDAQTPAQASKTAPKSPSMASGVKNVTQATKKPR